MYTGSSLANCGSYTRSDDGDAIQGQAVKITRRSQGFNHVAQAGGNYTVVILQIVLGLG
jgi:hypothetical protein